MTGELAGRLEAYRTRVERALSRWLTPTETMPPRLIEAMRYSVLAPGKRVRPALCYLTGDALGVPLTALDGPAAALELIHSYSLIHDDLPAMDDDDLRRGRPTCHRQFDEATAILAGDALQVLAFEILASDPAMSQTPAQRLDMIRLLAQAAGPSGMAGGQAVDLAAQGHELDVAALEAMHRKKTGALISASIGLAAASVAGLEPAVRDALARYGESLGLAFQVQDDLLDVEGDAGEMGKTAGADAARDKPTYTSLLGVEEARRVAHRLAAEAREAAEMLGPAGRPLAAMADFVVSRRN